MSTIKTIHGNVNSRNVVAVRVLGAAVESKRGGFIGRTVVGAVALGPLGAVIGAATTKTKNTTIVTFEVVFKTGEVFQGIAPQADVEEFARDVEDQQRPANYVPLVAFAAFALFIFVLAHI